MACDVIALVRQECKEINLIQQQQQQKRATSASVRVCYSKIFCSDQTRNASKRIDSVVMLYFSVE